MKLQFFETSAKDGTNIDKAFECIVNKVIESIYSTKPKEDNDDNRKPSFLLTKKKDDDKKPGGCCK